MTRQTIHCILFTLAALALLAAACNLAQPAPADDGRNLAATLASQGTLLANLATHAAGQAQDELAQWAAISALSTQVPLTLGLVTPVQAQRSPTPYPMCTPPACAPEEMYYCPGECPGGCGTTCATATPGVSSGFGEVWGKVCPPAESTSEIHLYFQDLAGWQLRLFSIAADQDSYRFELPAGVYVAFATASNAKYWIGTYSQYVLCGARESCSDHSQVPFLVREGHVTTGVDICDWQADVDELPSPLQ